MGACACGYTTDPEKNCNGTHKVVKAVKEDLAVKLEAKRMSEQIDQFFAPDGTLISIPVKPAKKIAVLKEIAKKLSPDTKYPEKELNAVIATYHPDTAAIRRYMIEYGILERDGGSVYWVTRSETR